MIGILSAVILYLITTELWFFVARRRRRAQAQLITTRLPMPRSGVPEIGENQLNSLGDRH